LLHLVDMCPVDGSDPVENARAIIRELELFSETLVQRTRWLVLNKADLLLDEEVEEIRERMIRELPWSGPIYTVSAAEKQGTEALTRDLQNVLDQIWEEEKLDPELAEQERNMQDRMQAEARRHIQALREKYLAARKGGAITDDDRDDDDDFDDDDDDDVEVEYVR